jgi:DNA-binding response OmpR family regulator
MKILLIEDEVEIANFVVVGLRAEHFTVDVHVRFLRAKVDDGHRQKLIKTVHGYGYKIGE